MSRRGSVVFIGAFEPRPDVVGGNVVACRALLASPFSEAWELRLLDSTTPSVPPPALPIRVGRAIARAGRLGRLLFGRPDALIAFSSGGLSFLEKATYSVAARVLGVPSLLWVRDGHFMARCRHSRSFRALARLFLRAPTRVLCQGASWKAFYEGELGVPAEKVRVVENWLGDARCLAVGEKRGPDPSGPLTIVFLGWIETAKGVLELTEAAARLARDPAIPPFQVRLVGDGSQTEAVKRRIGQLGLQDRVELTGWKQDWEKLDILGEANIFVLPSHAEGLPNAMLEAMACALPCIVTPVGAVPDIIEDGINGVLVSPKDVPALADALRTMLLDGDLRRSLGLAAHHTARQRFGVDRAATELSDILIELMRGPTVTAPGAG